MSVAGDGIFGRTLRNDRRRVSIKRDGDDFVASLQPHNEIIFRHYNASELRKLCRSLRIEIISDTVADPNNLASW